MKYEFEIEDDSKDFFENDADNVMEVNALAYFGDRRVKELFPDREIVVKLDNDLMGEYGLCVTMYEDVQYNRK